MKIVFLAPAIFESKVTINLVIHSSNLVESTIVSSTEFNLGVTTGATVFDRPALVSPPLLEKFSDVWMYSYVETIISLRGPTY